MNPELEALIEHSGAFKASIAEREKRESKASDDVKGLALVLDNERAALAQIENRISQLTAVTE